MTDFSTFINTIFGIVHIQVHIWMTPLKSSRCYKSISPLALMPLVVPFSRYTHTLTCSLCFQMLESKFHWLRSLTSQRRDTDTFITYPVTVSFRDHSRGAVWELFFFSFFFYSSVNSLALDRSLNNESTAQNCLDYNKKEQILSPISHKEQRKSTTAEKGWWRVRCDAGFLNNVGMFRSSAILECSQDSKKDFYSICNFYKITLPSLCLWFL